MVVSEASGEDKETRAILRQKIVDGTRSGTPVAEIETPTQGESRRQQ